MKIKEKMKGMSDNVKKAGICCLVVGGPVLVATVYYKSGYANGVQAGYANAMERLVNAYEKR